MKIRYNDGVKRNYKCKKQISNKEGKKRKRLTMKEIRDA